MAFLVTIDIVVIHIAWLVYICYLVMLQVTTKNTTVSNQLMHPQYTNCMEPNLHIIEAYCLMEHTYNFIYLNQQI
jgi:hypothetical protein